MVKKILIALIATIVLVVVMRWQGNQLVSDIMPKGIVSFELAKNIKEADAMIAASNLRALKTNTYLDFLFIAAYTAFLYLSCKWVINNLQSPKLKILGWAFLELSLAVGALDILENITMLMTMSGNGSNLSVGISKWSAMLKFSFAAIVVLYLLISYFAIMVSGKKKIA